MASTGGGMTLAMVLRAEKEGLPLPAATAPGTPWSDMTTGIKVISVDYRMPPDFPYPAALDDAMAVWKEVVKTTNPKNIAIFGTSL
jgi:acetyl esterase/lipase